MPTYAYRAIDSRGTQRSVCHEARDADALIRAARAAGHHVLMAYVLAATGADGSRFRPLLSLPNPPLPSALPPRWLRGAICEPRALRETHPLIAPFFSRDPRHAFFVPPRAWRARWRLARWGRDARAQDRRVVNALGAAARRGALPYLGPPRAPRLASDALLERCGAGLARRALAPVVEAWLRPLPRLMDRSPENSHLATVFRSLPLVTVAEDYLPPPELVQQALGGGLPGGGRDSWPTAVPVRRGRDEKTGILEPFPLTCSVDSELDRRCELVRCAADPLEHATIVCEILRRWPHEGEWAEALRSRQLPAGLTAKPHRWRGAQAGLPALPGFRLSPPHWTRAGSAIHDCAVFALGLDGLSSAAYDALSADERAVADHAVFSRATGAQAALRTAILHGWPGLHVGHDARGDPIAAHPARHRVYMALPYARYRDRVPLLLGLAAGIPPTTLPPASGSRRLTVDGVTVELSARSWLTDHGEALRLDWRVVAD